MISSRRCPATWAGERTVRRIADRPDDPGDESLRLRGCSGSDDLVAVHGCRREVEMKPSIQTKTTGGTCGID